MMTAKEAIEILREERDYAQLPCYVNQALEKAIKALGKQIPKKRIKYKDEIVCPSCKTLVGSAPYCRYCGQALDWGEEE